MCWLEAFLNTLGLGPMLIPPWQEKSVVHTNSFHANHPPTLIRQFSVVVNPPNYVTWGVKWTLTIDCTCNKIWMGLLNQTLSSTTKMAICWISSKETPHDELWLTVDKVTRQVRRKCHWSILRLRDTSNSFIINAMK